LSEASVFDAAVGDMKQLPIKGTVPFVDAAVACGLVDEAGVKPVSELVLDAAVLDPLKVVALVVIPKELAKLATAPDIFNSELTKAVVKGVDDKFMTDLIAATPPGTATGDRAGDFATLIGAITSGANAQFFMAATPTIVKEWCAYPISMMPSGTSLAPTGGTVGGVRVMASDVLDAGVIVAFDASQLVGSAGTVELSSAQHANVDMAGSTSPTFSLWQKNCVGLRAERRFAYAIPRASAVASLANASYVPGSPA
jgi:hypothetical protein